MPAENIVILVMDTARYRNDLGFFFEDDHLSRTGVSFTEAYTSAPWTVPSHASLFTGTSPSKHGAHAGHKHLDNTLITLPEILQSYDYETVAVSNNTWISEEFGFDQGFETFYKTWQYVQSETDLGRIARQEEGLAKLTGATKALFDGNPVTNLTNAIYAQFFRKTDDDGAARTNEWTEDWLTNRDDSRPFFLFINYIEPHIEYRPPEEHAKEYLPEGVTYEDAMGIPQDAWAYIADKVKLSDADFEVLRALYQAEIAYLDEKIGAIIDLLKTEGEWEDTLFVVTSDHGENIGEHGLMDHQYALYDTLVHVPLYLHGGPFEGDETENLVQLLDLPPTILDVLDIDAPQAREQFQGISFHPDVEESREYVISEYLSPQPSMCALEKRVDNLPDHVYTYDRSLRAIRTRQHKYIRGSDGSQELYELDTDPRETDNLADTHDQLCTELDETLDEWLDSFEHAEHTKEVSMSEDAKARLEDLGYIQ